MAYQEDITKRAIEKKLNGIGMTNDEIGALNAYNKSVSSPTKSVQQSNAPSFSDIENQRAKMFGNSSAPTPQQYFAASQSLGNGSYRPVSNNYNGLPTYQPKSESKVNLNQDKDYVDLLTRITTLEALLSGLSRRTVHICDGGTDKTMTIVSTAPA